MNRLSSAKTKASASAGLTLSASAFYRFVSMGIIVDGRAGGLIVGNRHDQGGVAVIRQHGQEFVLQKERVAFDDFVLFSGLEKPTFTGPTSPDRSQIRSFSHLLVTDAAPDDKILWLTHSQVVVPAEEALSHLGELTEMNTQKNPFLFCDLEELFEPRYLYPEFQS